MAGGFLATGVAGEGTDIRTPIRGEMTTGASRCAVRRDAWVPKEGSTELNPRGIVLFDAGIPMASRRGTGHGLAGKTIALSEARELIVGAETPLNGRPTEDPDVDLLVVLPHRSTAAQDPSARSNGVGSSPGGSPP